VVVNVPYRREDPALFEAARDRGDDAGRPPGDPPA
jgi:hypothetical protein